MSIQLKRWIPLSVLFFMGLGILGSTTAEARKPWKDKGRRGWAYRVYLSSTPDNAAVYVNDKKHGIMCYTPCNRIKMPRKKDFKLIFVKDGFKDHVEKAYFSRSWSKQYVRVVLVRQIQPGILDIQSDATGNATGAMIYVDGALKGTVPMKVKVKPGRHQVVVKRAGYSSHSQWVTIAEKQIWTVQAILKPLAKPKGTLLISADVNGAEVLVDGKSVGYAPVVVPNLEPGPHTVEIRKAGASPWKQVVVVQSGKTATVKAAIGSSIPKSGTLRVICNVPGADVYVDGDKKGVCPATVTNLIPGDHIVLVKAPGYLPKQVPFKVVVNQQSLVSVDLEKRIVKEPSGTLRVQCDQADAMIMLDGKQIGKAPMEVKDVRPGLHIVKVTKAGFMTHTEKFTMKKGEVYTITALLKAGGHIKITSSPPGATIFIDTRPVGRTPLLDYVLEVGTYTLEVEMNRYHREKRSIAIEGGKTMALHMDLQPIQSGPTREQVIRGLSSFGAMTVAPGQFTSDITLGFMPYFGVFRLTVGAWKWRNLGLDAGVIINVQGVINSFAAHARFQFLKAGPFSMGAFTEIGGGPGWEGRNTFEFALGAVASLSFRELITVSVRMWGKVYSDSFCPSEPANDALGESEPGWCSRMDNIADNDPYWDEVPDTFEGDLKGNEHRTRITKARFMMSLTLEIAFAKWASLHLILQGAPGSAQRAMWHDFFNRPMPESKSGGDPRIYGGAGITFKF